VFHVQLRQFPHNATRFNLDDGELAALIVPWSNGEWVEFGERKWSPHQAQLTVLEGPRLEASRLTMGRGWRAAEHDGADVTARVLASARQADPAASTDARGQPPEGRAVIASAPARGADGDALRPQLLSLLGGDEALLEAWRHAAALYRGRSPSESLALAEDAIRSGEGV
jgi:hypothetical protein